MLGTYAATHSPRTRRREADRVRERYPSRVPVIVERQSARAPPLDRSKYIVPTDMSAAHFMVVLRSRLQFRSTDAFFLFCKGRLLSGETRLSTPELASADGFVYVVYDIENAFGA